MGAYASRETLASKFFDDVNEHGNANNSSVSEAGAKPSPTLWNTMTNLAQNTLSHLSSDSGEPSIDPYELNRDVFDNNLEKLDTVWRTDVDKLNEAMKVYDVHGLSPLHLAFRMGRLEYLELFVEKAHPKYFHFHTKMPAPLNWNVLDESVVLGNRHFIREVLKLQSKRETEVTEGSSAFFEKMLSKTNNVYLQIRWKVKTWIPLVSRFLPNDTVSVYKQGNMLRVDTCMTVGQKQVKFGGQSSIVYNSEKYGANCVVIIDRTRGVYKVEKSEKKLTDEMLEERVNALLRKPVEAVSVSTKQVHFAAETKKGKLKFDQIGKYEALCYKWSGVKLTVHKRVEHLAPELVKEIRDKSKNEHIKVSEVHLQPPKEPKGTFEEYLARKVSVGRNIKIITWEKQLKGSVALANNFPMSVQNLLGFIKVDSEDARKLFKDLADYISHSVPLPPGFPVYLELPVVPTTKFYVKLLDFSWTLPGEIENDSDFFLAPTNFKEVEEL